MKRLLVAGLVLAAAAVGAVIYSGLARDREYRRLVAEGDRSLAADQTFLAIEAYSGAVALKGDSMLAYLRRGETYRRRGDFVSALRDLREAVRLDPTATHPLEQLGDVLYAMQRYDRAAERYGEYVRLDSNAPRIFYKLSLARYRDSNVAAAIPPLRRAILLEAGFAEAHYLLGLCLREQHRDAEALESLRRAVVLAPGSIRAREGLASQLATLSRIDAQIIQLEALAALDPDRPDRLVSLGLAYARRGQRDEAISALRRATERFPDQPLIYLALAQIWLEDAVHGDRIALSKALEALQNAGGARPTSSEALTLQGRALLLAGDEAAAERMFQQATSQLPVPPEAFKYLADTAERHRNLAGARDALVRYEAISGPRLEAAVRADVTLRIAELSLVLDEPAVAAQWFERATELTPPTGRLLGRLAEALWRAGDVPAARETLAQALEKAPGSRALLALRQRIEGSE